MAALIKHFVCAAITRWSIRYSYFCKQKDGTVKRAEYQVSRKNYYQLAEGLLLYLTPAIPVSAADQLKLWQSGD